MYIRNYFPPILFVLYSCFDKSVEEWRQFHCDLNDFSQWLMEAEGLLAEARLPEGSLDLEMAKIHQQVSILSMKFSFHKVQPCLIPI